MALHLGQRVETGLGITISPEVAILFELFVQEQQRKTLFSDQNFLQIKPYFMKIYNDELLNSLQIVFAGTFSVFTPSISGPTHLFLSAH